MKRRMTGGALSEAARALRGSPVSRNVFDCAKHATEFAVRGGVSIVCSPLTLITAGYGFASGGHFVYSSLSIVDM